MKIVMKLKNFVWILLLVSFCQKHNEEVIHLSNEVFNIDNGTFSTRKIKDIPIEYKIPKIVVKSKDFEDYNIIDPRFVKYNVKNGKVYIADSGNCSIVVLDSLLNYIDIFGEFGQGPGEFRNPRGISFIHNDDIVISDWGNQRIQFYTKDFKFLSQISVEEYWSMPQYVQVDSKGNLYFKLFYKDSLIVVLDRVGGILKKFGKLFELEEIYSDEPSFRYFESEFHYNIDNHNNIYCAFINRPILRKYDENFQLVFEVNYSSLPIVQLRLQEWIELVKAKNNKKVYISKNYTRFLSVDEKNIYVQFISKKSFPVYVFNKENGEIEKCIYFKDNTGKNTIYECLDCTSKNYIYAINRINKTIAVFNK